jgi:hypothetical protein
MADPPMEIETNLTREDAVLCGTAWFDAAFRPWSPTPR